MRKTENRILSVLSWFHATALFGSLYFLVPSLAEILDYGMMGNFCQMFVLFIPVITSFYLLRKVRNLFLYLCAAAGIIAGIYYMTGNWLTVICSILIFIIRLSVRIEKGRIKRQMREFPGELGRFYDPEYWDIPTFLDKPQAIHWIVIIAEYMILIFSGYHQYLGGMFVLLFVEILLTALYQFVDHMKGFVLGHQKIANLPGKMILRNGYVIGGGLFFLFVIFLLPSVLYGKEPLTALYHPPQPKTYQAEVEIEQAEDQGADPMMELIQEMGIEKKDPPAWLLMLNKILIWATTLLIIIAAVRFLFLNIANLLRSFAEEDEDEVLSLKEVKEEQERIRRERKKQDRRLRNTTQGRIRRKYKKWILKAARKKPAGIETPTELEQFAGVYESENRRQYHELYEKARYSDLECTGEEEQCIR